MKHHRYHWTLSFIAALGALTATVTAADESSPIDIELPKPFFGGTPIDGAFGPNVDLPNYTDREPFLAPSGTKIISLGKPVTASAPPNVGTLKQVVDGDKSYLPKSVIELPEGIQWIQIDLESRHNLYAIIVWHFHEGIRIYFDFVVQLSDDPEFKKDVTTLYNTDRHNALRLGVDKDNAYVEDYKGRLIDTKGAAGRYLRIYGQGNNYNNFTHFIEVEVWGKVDKNLDRE